MTNNDLAIALKGKKLILASGSPRSRYALPMPTNRIRPDYPNAA